MVKIKEEENLVNPRCDCFRGKTCFLSYKMLHLGIHLSSPNPSLQSFTVKTPWAKPFLETVNVGFSFLQEGFYIFSQAFPRLSFSHTVWRLSSVGNGSRVLLHRSHSKRCERVFLSQEISISIGLAKGAAFASSLCVSPKCSVGWSCVQSNAYSHTYVLILQEPVGCSWAVLLPRKDWSTLAFSGLLSLWPVTCLKPTW